MAFWRLVADIDAHRRFAAWDILARVCNDLRIDLSAETLVVQFDGNLCADGEMIVYNQRQRICLNHWNMYTRARIDYRRMLDSRPRTIRT